MKLLMPIYNMKEMKDKARADNDDMLILPGLNVNEVYHMMSVLQ